MIARPKFKESWLARPDNSKLVVEPRQFLDNSWFQGYQKFDALLHYLASPFKRSTNLIKIQKLQQFDHAIQQLLKDSFIIVKVYNQQKLSYKGFISWMLVANTNVCYLIDVIALRNHMQKLRNIFENPQITKLVYNFYEVAGYLLRDFQLIVVNIFDLIYLEHENQRLAQLGKEERQRFQQQFYQSPEMIAERPIKSKLLKIINRNLIDLIQYTKLQLKMSYSSSDPDNNKIFKEYYRINFMETAVHSYRHYPSGCLTEQQKDDLNQKRIKLYESLLHFREHVARIYDISVETILPKPVILRILKNSKISVLQISQLYEQCDCQSVGLELCKRIYDIIQLNQQVCEDLERINTSILEKQLNKKQANQSTNINAVIKKLLQDLQWGDSSQWLNRRDDPSLKLYKEIVSINQFDYSIGQQYSSLIKSQVLKRSQIGRYLKYAQYMRNKNYEKLENLYNMSSIVKQSKTKIDQFSEETEFDIKNQKTNQKSAKFRTLFQNQQPVLKSSTSLDQNLVGSPIFKSDSRIKSQKLHVGCESQKQIMNMQQSSESRSRKSSSSVSFTQNMDKNISRDDIRPLPESLEQIYQIAQQIKKKSDKKGKKEKKGKQETKQVEFIPTWQDIQELINQFNNLK